MRVFTLIALLLASGCGSGDDAAGAGGSVEWTGERGPLRMTVRVTPEAVSAGDRLTLVLEVEAPAGFDLDAAILEDSLGSFAIRAVDTTPNDRFPLRHRYEIDTFAVGDQEIPLFELAYTDRRPETLAANGGPIEATLTSEVLTVTVESTLGGDDALRDIRAAVDLPVGIAAWVWWVAAAAVLVVLAAALVLWLGVSRRADVKKAEPQIPSDIWALDALTRLDGEDLPGQGRFADYYFALSDVVREYIERRFGLRAPERTTEEFLREVRGHGALTQIHKDLLAGFLRAADLVKFARHEPTVAEAVDAMACARGFVEQTRPTVQPSSPGIAA